MDHHGDICSDAASGSSYDWNILRTLGFPASRVGSPVAWILEATRVVLS